jgi:hypothetical protein
MGQIRGVAIVGTMTYVREHFGEEALANVFDAIGPGSRQVLGARGENVIENGWYDAHTLADLTMQADVQLGKGDLSLARVIGKELAFRDVHRLFRWLFKLAGPATLFRRASAVWTSYYNGGRYVVEAVEEKRATLRIDDWDSAEPALCSRLEGWIERACELTIGEAAEPKVHETHHRCHDAEITSGPFCRFVAEWK